MKDLLNFFISFDKLMKEKLVKAFYWLALILIVMKFASQVLDKIWLDPIAHIIMFFAFFVKFLFAIVSLRLVAEIAIAIFRINNNLSPDGGKSETADIDPIEEARRAGEEAAKRAREASSSVVQRTKSAAADFKDDVEEKVDDVEDSVEEAVAKTRKAVAKNTSSAKMKKDGTPAKKRGPKPGTKRAPAKTKDGVRLKKDGTPYKKPGPKPKS